MDNVHDTEKGSSYSASLAEGEDGSDRSSQETSSQITTAEFVEKTDIIKSDQSGGGVCSKNGNQAPSVELNDSACPEQSGQTESTRTDVKDFLEQTGHNSSTETGGGGCLEKYNQVNSKSESNQVSRSATSTQDEETRTRTTAPHHDFLVDDDGNMWVYIGRYRDKNGRARRRYEKFKDCKRQRDKDLKEGGRSEASQDEESQEEESQIGDSQDEESQSGALQNEESQPEVLCCKEEHIAKECKALTIGTIDHNKHRPRCA